MGKSKKKESSRKTSVVASLELAADLKNLAVLRNAVDRIGTDYDLAPRQVTRMKLCVDEAFSNIVWHGFKGKGGKTPVTVEFKKGKKDFTVIFRDRGVPFRMNLKKLTWPDLEKYIEMGKKGGLGLVLMKKFSDHLDIKNKDGINILSLKYKLKR